MHTSQQTKPLYLIHGQAYKNTPSSSRGLLFFYLVGKAVRQTMEEKQRWDTILVRREEGMCLTFHRRANPKCERKTTAPKRSLRSPIAHTEPSWRQCGPHRGRRRWWDAKSHRRWSSPSWLSVWWAAWTPAAPRSWWTCWCPWSFHKCTCLLWTISVWFQRCPPSLETLCRRDILGGDKDDP